ncbi:hypothetical protein QRX60_25065 [Amycolatopsis mongoliensis]|uniref:Uncharacterized protein n=1 Tax=Amycolatopsis mongoliensis TaxID=715475 RepID=A0A9Y2JYE6_9PSEU|nr:hypothetical protein [Amycolatopsis sp. 4-36]WIY06965.1 hypothetical protein QRX60_25065 [Amycolatopsis sp. 4-36]
MTASTSLTDAATSVGTRVGRYFGIVGMIPSLFLVLWGAVLITSNSWRGRPDLQQLSTALSGWTPSSYAGALLWILLASLIVGLVLNPLQFGMTRLLEGYWGSSGPARLVLRWRIGRHRRRLDLLDNRRKALRRRRIAGLDRLLQDLYDEDPRAWDAQTREARRNEVFDSVAGANFAGLRAAEDALFGVIRSYPTIARTMPTRLGNVLRGAEDRVGKQYGLDVILTAQHFSLVAEQRHLDHLRDARQQFDMTVRLCVVFMVATVMTCGFLATDGLWLLVALVPYAFSWLAYRATAASAADYMTIMATVVDLNRFKLYESLHTELPRNSVEERWNNEKLMKLMDQDRRVSVRYKHPDSGSDAAPPTPPGNP